MMVDDRISQIDGFPDELKLSIRHMIASHHGKINGSDVAPKTPEAILLHRMDGLDITMDKIRTQRCNGWSAYDEVLKTEVYFG
jgi:3'-5' exoribonuclease